ncbi:MAG: hypothetical protein WDN04_26395 [Rhodospirillales bacterium]
MRGPVWSWIAALDLSKIGFVIVGLFLSTWIVAVAIWKYGRLETRWAGAFHGAAVEGE